MAADTAHLGYEIEVVGMSGTVSTTIPLCWLAQGITVGFLEEWMEDGMYDRVPGAETDEKHMNMERFLLVCDHRRMAPDEFVLDYYRTKN